VTNFNIPTLRPHWSHWEKSRKTSDDISCSCRHSKLETSRKRVGSGAALALGVTPGLNNLFSYAEWQPKGLHTYSGLRYACWLEGLHTLNWFTLSLTTVCKPQKQRQLYMAVVVSSCSHSNAEVIQYECLFICFILVLVFCAQIWTH
jgi:hypothetical protein